MTSATRVRAVSDLLHRLYLTARRIVSAPDLGCTASAHRVSQQQHSSVVCSCSHVVDVVCVCCAVCWVGAVGVSCGSAECGRVRAAARSGRRTSSHWDRWTCRAGPDERRWTGPSRRPPAPAPPRTRPPISPIPATKHTPHTMARAPEPISRAPAGASTAGHRGRTGAAHARLSVFRVWDQRRITASRSQRLALAVSSGF